MIRTPSLPRPARTCMLAALAATSLLACGTTTDPQGPGRDPGPTEAPVIGPDATIALCDMLRDDVGTWQTQDTTAAKVGFNGTVHSWALRHGAVNLAVANHREVIDTVTAEKCPEIRGEVVGALGTADLASGLAGY
ncbi:hypothetical protein ACFYTF_23710 [Nocardia thailandica]|uniref:Lipoprotein n=1 Tax=Nocardia thailandica TaxID=257275 RepID=A0ABW6PU03_9NOCA